MFAASAGEYVPGRKRPDLSEELLGGLDVEDFVVRFDHAHLRRGRRGSSVERFGVPE